MPAPKISLIISTYQRPDALEKVFRGLLVQTLMPHEIIVSDDGSGEPTRKLIEAWRGRLNLRHVWHEDAGFRKTIILNKSLAASTGEYIVLLDGDCIPHKRFIADHAVLAEKNFWVQGRRSFVREKWVPEFELEGASVTQWCLMGRITGIGKAFRLPFPIVQRNKKHRGVIGCNMGFWRADLVAVNGFDEDYTGWGIGEDSDLGARLYNLNRPRKFVHGNAIVFHLDHPQQPKSHVPESLRRLEQTIATGKIRCQNGLEKYL